MRLDHASFSDFLGEGGYRTSPETDLLVLKVGRESYPNYVYGLLDRRSGDAVVIDPGWEADLIVRLLNGVGAHLRAILLTHSHLDHVGAAGTISKLAECPIFISAEEIDCPALAGRRVEAYGSQTHHHFGSLAFEVIATPGHTPGSVCLLTQGRLFTGDTLFNEGCGLARTRYGAGSVVDLFGSLERLRLTIPGDCLVYPGHRYATPLGASFADVVSMNFYMRLQKLETFVRFCERPAREAASPPPIDAPLMRPIHVWLKQLKRMQTVSQPLVLSA